MADKNGWQDSDYQALFDEGDKGGFRAEDALCIFASESGLEARRATNKLPGSGPFAYNPNYGGAKGLFQGMPDTLKGLGFIPGEDDYDAAKGDFREVPIARQIVFFGRFLDKIRRQFAIRKWQSAGDIYIANFYPAALAHKNDPTWAIAKGDSLVYRANKALDHENKGFITTGDMSQQAEVGRSKPAYKAALASMSRIRGFCGLPNSPETWKDAQRRLNQGHSAPVITEDGIPGPETEHAVSYFQASNHLPVTGRLDSATYKELINSTH